MVVAREGACRVLDELLRGPSVAGVEVGLSAAGLRRGEVHADTEPLQQLHGRDTGGGKQGVVQAGDEEGDTHSGRIGAVGAPWAEEGAVLGGDVTLGAGGRCA